MKYFLTWFAMGILCFAMIIDLFSSPEKSLNNLREVEIQIDEIQVTSFAGKYGYKTTLNIRTADESFCVRYPKNWYRSTYMDYQYAVSTELLTHTVQSVSAKITDKQSIWDWLHHRHQIVDLRAGNSVYYDITTEKDSISRDYSGSLVLTPIIWILWLFATLYFAFIYKVIKVIRMK